MGKVACGGWIAATLAIGSLAGPAFGADSERAVRAAGVAHDGPFGIAMGEPLSEVGPVEEIAPALYHVLAPPRANQDLTYVAVVAYPETGVCEIEGRGPKARLDPKGVQVRTTVNQIAEALIDKYGPYSQKTEYCNRLELCDSYWVSELKNGDAKLEYSWDFSKSPPRPDNIYWFTLDVRAEDTVTSYADIIYVTSKRRDDCIAASKRGAASGL